MLVIHMKLYAFCIEMMCFLKVSSKHYFRKSQINTIYSVQGHLFLEINAINEMPVVWTFRCTARPWNL